MLHQFSFNERQGLNPEGLAKVKWQGPLTDRDTFLTKFMHKDGNESYRGWIIAETLEEAQKIFPMITNDMHTYERKVYLGSGIYEKRRFLNPKDELEDLEASSPLGWDFDPSGYTDYPTQEDLQEYGCVSNQEN